MNRNSKSRATRFIASFLQEYGHNYRETRPFGGWLKYEAEEEKYGKYMVKVGV
jgi:hypothetical protein